MLSPSHPRRIIHDPSDFVLSQSCLRATNSKNVKEGAEIRDRRGNFLCIAMIWLGTPLGTGKASTKYRCMRHLPERKAITSEICISGRLVLLNLLPSCKKTMFSLERHMRFQGYFIT